ncbi:hypothetical protein [Runella sp. SP2]|uniref:hypothetical protein n=1 Tax=Runella sp. SP2 TaxID=2268026 RepID=UPI000F07D628|nr:hypothetical protein [Runella sp. SP2]AYQ35171.1 hypothetical protein DTQ70_24725 [Runella sp. SP2]
MQRKKLIDLILRERSFRFTESALGDYREYDVEYLWRKGGEHVYGVVTSDFNLQIIINGLKLKFEVSKIESWEVAINFLDLIISFFDKNVGEGIENQEFIKYNLGGLIFNEVPFLANYDFLLTNLEDTSIKSPHFVGFLNVVFKQNFPEDIIYKQFKRLDEQKYQFYFRTIVDTVKYNTEKAKKLSELYFKDNNIVYFENFRAILCGIVEVEGQASFNLLRKYGERIEFQPSITNALATLKTSDSKIIFEAYNIIVDFVNNDSVILQLIWFFIKIFENEGENPEFLDVCRLKLLELTSSESHNVQHALLDNLNYIPLNQNEKANILIELTKNQFFYKGFLTPNGNNIRQLDWTIRQCITLPNLYIDFLRQFSKYHIFKCEYFECTLKEMIDNSLDDFLRFSVECLTDYEGHLRYLGYELISYVVESFKDISITPYIQNLSEEKQCIVFLSIYISSIDNFEQLYPLILPLINSKYSSISQLLIAGLNKKFTVYPNLLKAIEEVLEENEIKKELVHHFRIEEEIYQTIKIKKVKLKEFDPFYAQHRIFQQYQKEFNEKWRKNISEAQERSIIGKLGIKKTVLLKGGGYKREGQESVNKLSRFQTTVNVPEGALINSDSDLFRRNLYFSDTWSSINDWQKWLIRL